MSGGDAVDLWQVYPDDLIAAPEAAALAGVSEAAIRQWATRKKIRRFPGRRRAEPTLYARPEILAEAERIAAARAKREHADDDTVALAA